MQGLSKRSRQGFTLVELSIVLVILGLLVGGVLSGQSLIHAAQLRAITEEHDKFDTAIYAFRDKYSDLPGDLPTATTFWGTDPNGCPSNAIQTPGTATCNGNGDGYIGDGYAGDYDFGWSGWTPEIYRAWQQLAAAGMIEGQYSGVTGPGSISVGIPGVNVPKSKYPNAGWTYQFMAPDPHPGTPTYGMGIDTYNYLVFGAMTNVAMIGTPGFGIGGTDWEILTPSDAWNIDTKMDDGKPAMGTIRSNSTNGCVTAYDSTAQYNLGSSAINCALYFQEQ